MARILYGEKFPFVHLQISTYCYLLINFSDAINDVTESQAHGSAALC